MIHTMLNFKIFLIFHTIFCVVNGQLKCLTTSDSKDPNTPCIFPFKFKGKIYDACPPDPEFPSRTWCSTKVDNRGKHVTGQGKYGFCEESCPRHKNKKPVNLIPDSRSFKIKEDLYAHCKTKDGKQCQFPFKHKGVLYYGCPPDPVKVGEHWCSTKVDAQGNHITGKKQFGLCNNKCPLDKPAPSVGSNQCRGGEKCRPTVQCNSQFPKTKDLKRRACQLDDHSPGTCCKDISKSWGPRSDLTVQRGGIGSSAGLRQANIPFDASKFSDARRRRFFDLGQSWAKNVTVFSRRLAKKNKPRRSTRVNALNSKSSPGAVEMGRNALANMKAAQLMLEDGGVELRQGLPGLVGFLPDTGSTLDFNVCPFNDPSQQPICDQFTPYRTIQGECNNLRNPFFGKSFTPLSRVLDNAYEDGIIEPRLKSVSGRPLPGTRAISTTIRKTPETQIENPDFCSLFVAFAQFVDHDADHVPITTGADGEEIECCEEGEFVPFEEKSEEEQMLCTPIPVPRRDVLSPLRCINMVRSVAVDNLECSGGAVQQLNQITHWLDSSNVYGSLPTVARSVREFKNGLLDTVIGPDGKEQLPVDPDRRCVGEATGTCQLSGDLRNNEQPTLGAMHTLFLREHNRIARALKKLNPRWNDERLFQESRRINNAQYQHIIYNEFLPIMIGKTFLDNFGLSPLTRGFSDTYRSDFDPRVTNEFISAAFRVGHTLIPSVIQTFSAITGKARRTVELADVFADGDILRERNFLDELIKGLTIQSSEEFDNHFVEDVTLRLFDEAVPTMDLVAINLNRGREHGIQPYIKYRQICGTGGARIGQKVTSFNDLGTNISPENIRKLKEAYESVEDIDLFAGLTMEKPYGDALVGETYICLIGDVFARLRFGDRFFYDLKGQAGSFTEDQLDQIRKISMARIICDNTNIEEIQPLAFRRANSDTNRLTSCVSRLFLEGIPSVDLSVFRG